MNKTLSVSIIAKNEEHNLPKCIESISSIADEIIVVDTGSTDNTVEIARNLGAKIFFYNWDGDFSAAKNIALDHCTMDWVLVLDCDEVLDFDASLSLKAAINDTSIEGFYLRLINIIGEVKINEIPALRLFRNRPEYRFKGKLHEQIYYSIVDFKDNTGLQTTDFILRHYGYDHNIVDMSKKTDRNISILNSYPEEDRDGFFYFNLGSEYLKLGNNELARDSFQLALTTESMDYGYYPFLSVNLVKSLLSFKQPQEALDKCDFFLYSMQDFRELYFLRAMCQYELGRYRDSYNSLYKFRELPPLPNKYPSLNFENDNDIDGLLSALKQSIN